MSKSSELLLKIIRLLPSIPLNGYDVLLCYHAIDSDDDVFSVDVKTFTSHLNHIKRNFHLVDFEQIIKEKNNGNEIRVAVSFDDGYKSVITNALPVIRESGITASVFVIGEPLKHSENNKPHLTISDCKQLIKLGWTIGWHTNNHIDLLVRNDSIVSRDFNSYKKRFEKKLRKKIRYIAYPFGRYSSSTERIAKKSGFVHGFSVSGGWINKKKFTIERVTITSDMSGNDVIKIIKPLGLLTNKLFTTAWSYKDK